MPSHFAVSPLGGKVGYVIDVWVLVHLIYLFIFIFIFLAVSSLEVKKVGDVNDVWVLVHLGLRV
jgi:hypothetical protein